MSKIFVLQISMMRCPNLKFDYHGNDLLGRFEIKIRYAIR